MRATAILCALAIGLVASQGAAEELEDNKAARRFEFAYAGSITGLKPGARARIWLPIAESNRHQKVNRTRTNVGGAFKLTRDPKYGNRILYFTSVANAEGEIDFDVRYDVLRYSDTSDRRARAPDSLDVYLQANLRVPTQGVVERLFDQAPTGAGLALARKIYDRVDYHMRYDKPSGAGWGRGDTLWACDSRFGNCTDFHSLYISLSRELGVPARFEIGFPIPNKRQSEVGGYHCWAATVVNGVWFPVDISEADKSPAKRDFFFGNLDANRLKFSHGRDVRMAPTNKSGPINYFIYPHVEVDGKVHTELVKRFSVQASPAGAEE